MSTKLDPVTFEVLRHRLWEINDEMALIAARISGSPAVYESNDFNTGILTAEGRGLFCGVYIIRQAAVLDLVVKAVRERYERRYGINDGDFFLTNDPWSGALHQMDVAVVAPCFWEGEIVAWTGVVMHENDVGGPQPGSWTVTARDSFEECPLIPPVRIAVRGEIETPIEEWFLRNTRTPGANGLNLRAKIASQQKAHERLREIIRRYGRDTFLALQDQIEDHVRSIVRQRLRELPDGTWYETGFVDHDGHDNILYPLKLAMTKRDDRLIFDFRGTSLQAPGPINSAYSGIVGGVLQITLPMLCYDTSWSAGAMLDCVEIISDEGTLNNARHPAATSMSTVTVIQATGNLIVQTISKLFGYRDAYANEVIATGVPSMNGPVLHGTDEDGKPFICSLTIPVGGGGARAFRDGIDSAGNMIAPGYATPNVERIEALYPLLCVYVKERRDTAGPGAYRGGAAIEMAVVPHRSVGPVRAVLRSTACSQLEAKGLFGGWPGSIQRQLVLRDSEVGALFASGRIPVQWEGLAGSQLEVLDAKGIAAIGPNDMLVNYSSGGGGYGDPLRRDPERVLADVRRDLVALDRADALYGVVLTAPGDIDSGATRERRDSIRQARLAKAQRGRQGVLPQLFERVAPAGMGLEIARSRPSEHYYRCTYCAAAICRAEEDPRMHAALVEERMDAITELNRFGLVDDFVLRQFCCPSCGSAFSVAVQLRSDAERRQPEARLAKVDVRPSGEG